MKRLPCPCSVGRRGDCAWRPADGFTLIELLIVIAILSVLLTLLLPALRRAQVQARDAVCRTNMYQMGLALRMYLPENTDRLPPSSCYEEDPKQYWLYVLNQYLDQPLLFRCPADRGGHFLDWFDPPAEDWSSYRWSSYATNGFFDHPEYATYRKAPAVKNPDLCVWVCELQDDNDGADHVHADRWESPGQLQRQVGWDRHGDRSNYLFIDCHVESRRWDQTWYYPHPNVNLWNPQTAPIWPKF